MRTYVLTLTMLAAAASVWAGASLSAQDDDDDADVRKMQEDALVKAVARGRDLFNSKELGKKTCASCHEDKEKPNLNLVTRAYSYPWYSNKAKNVVTLTQKLNEMVTSKSGGKGMDLAGADIAALEAYVVSLKKR